MTITNTQHATHAAIHAYTAWGFIAQPGDSRIVRWCEAEGVVEALARLRSRDSDDSLARAIHRRCEDAQISPSDIEALRARDNPARAVASVARGQELGLSVLHPGDSLWPARCADLGPHQPLALWVSGRPEALAHPSPQPRCPPVAVVGSRRASAEGVRVTRAIVHHAGALGATIISGGAHGIDVAAHRASLEREIPTLAVLAGGLDSLYPAANHGVLSAIATRGALVSESPCGRRARPEMFLHRNRLIAALAALVVVVEAAHRSGSLNTASHAATLGREVAVVPGRWSDPLSAGCLRMIRSRAASVLTAPEDLSLLLGLDDGASAEDCAHTAPRRE